MPITTVKEVINSLKEYDPDSEVNFEYSGNYIEMFDIKPAKDLDPSIRHSMGYAEDDIVIYLV